MRVAIYPGMAFANLGGSFTITDEIVRALAAKIGQGTHEFIVLAPSKETALRAACGDLQVVTLDETTVGRSTSARARRWARRMAYRLSGYSSTPNLAVERLLAANEIDVVWYPSAWECLTVEVPYITTVWDLQHRLQPCFPEVSRNRAWDNRERMFSAALRRASLVIAGTQAGQEEIERFYDVPRERIRLLPHPTPQFLDKVEPARPDLPDLKGDFIFYPAQFWPHKNHFALIEALHLLRQRDGLPISLVLTGSDMGNLPFLRAMIERRGLSSAVRVLGFVSREQLVWLYRHALALTYVTYFGPENLPPLEAFAAGCPVIASDVSGAREQLGDAAFLVNPRRPEQIADAVKTLHFDLNLRNQLVERGTIRAKRFTADDFVDGVVKWLDEFEPVRRCWPSGGLPVR